MYKRQLERATPAEAAELDAALGTALDETAVERLRKVIDSSGAHDVVEGMISELTARATAGLTAGDFDPHATAVLQSLAEAVTQRTV